MADFTVKLPSGVLWTPQFITEIDAESCIGCGRCFKVCARDVLTLVGVGGDGSSAARDDDDDDYDDDDEYDKKVMIIAKPENCIGCEACSQMCAKKCISYAPAQI